MRADNHIVNGVLVGTVRGEPDSLGRVEVEYEWMEGESQSFPAPIATMMSGSGRGTWFMPEDGDEVLVAFAHGRFDAPFIVGFLWNGANEPPTDDGIDRQVRRMRTVSGHVLEFDDRDGQTRVDLRSQAGHELVLDDSGVVTATTAQGRKLTLSDEGESAVLETPSGNKVTLADSGGTIRIESAGGVSIEIDSTGKATIFAPVGVDVTTMKATFTGILEAQLVKGTVGKFEVVKADAFVPTYGTGLP